MSQQTPYFPLSGGLDLITPAIALKPGVAIGAVNYEPVPNGYSRVEGFERFDGRTSPTDAYDAAADPVQGALDRTAARAAITAVPGSGSVRGVWEYEGSIYAFRDNVGATAGAMWKATSGGWTAVSLGHTLDFTSGGVAELTEGVVITGATSGATATVKRVIASSGDWTAGTAAGYVVLANIVGTFVAEDLNIPAQANVATIAAAPVAITLPAGGRYEFTNHNFYAGSATRRMYGCNGVGRAFEFDGITFTPIRSGVTADTPTRIAVHKMHLVLAFPGGQLTGSEPGDPLGYRAPEGAWTAGVGSDITDLVPANAGILTILAEHSISNLYGSSSDDFQLEVLSDEAGALPWTADKVGEPIYMDKRGLRRLSASQAFGNFSIGTLTQAVKPLIQDYAANGITPVASVRIRNKDQYRVFFSNNAGLTVYLGKKQPEILPFDLGKLVTCICSIEGSDGEAIYFGSSDGFVYQLDKGVSFDGGPVQFALRLPFNHQGAPQQLKRWHKVVVECDARSDTTIYVSTDFDYGDGNLPNTAQAFTITGGGGIWDVSKWDQFSWSGATESQMEAWVDGTGRNMSLLLCGETTDDPPHLLQGVTLFFTPRGLQR